MRGQGLGKGAGVARLVAGGVGAPGDVWAIVLERWLDAQQLLAADHLAVHTVAGHQFGRLGCRFKRMGVVEIVGDTVLQTLVLDAGGGHHLFKGGVAIGAQGDELLHIALKGGVVAIGQKLQAPGVLAPAGAKRVLRAKQQWRLFAQHPLERLERRLAVGPGFAIAHRDLPGVGKTGFQCGAALALDHGHLVAALGQMPGGADADDAGAQDDDVHGAQVCAIAGRSNSKITGFAQT